MKNADQISPPRCSPWFGRPLAESLVGLALFGALSLAALGCSALVPTEAGPDSTDTANSGKSIVMTTGLQPDWNLDQMVKRSDAVVVGTVAEYLRSTEYAGPTPGGEDPEYNREYRDYRFTVETVYHPSSLPDTIVVMAGPYSVQSNPQILIHDTGEIPGFSVNDRVMLFLDSLDDPAYSTGPGQTPPDGYTKADYYRPITGSYFGKLTENGEQWSDTRSNKSVSANQVSEAVDRQTGR